MNNLSVGIAGFGAVGQRLAQEFEKGIPGVALVALTSRDLDKARAQAASLLQAPPPVVPLAELAALADVVVEAAPAAAFAQIARAALTAGKTLLAITVGALLEEEAHYAALARQHGGTLQVVSGAIGGLDAIQGAAIGQVEAVVMTSRKPPRGLAGAPYVLERGIDLAALTEPQVIFEGSAREACKGFPANVNVSAAVSLAGVGADRTRIRIIADPVIERNMHEIEVTGEFGRFRVQIENVPTVNPRTGILTVFSIVAALRKLTAPLKVGT